jgi:hypothetical protein
MAWRVRASQSRRVLRGLAINWDRNASVGRPLMCRLAQKEIEHEESRGVDLQALYSAIGYSASNASARVRCMGVNSPKISGFVITYNSGEILKTCLRSLRFVDELIVVDKSSTAAGSKLRPKQPSRLKKTLKKIRSRLTGRRR